jgi:hypothetical protein
MDCSTLTVATELAPSLYAIRAKYRASARYGIYRNRLADNASRHIREDFPYRGLSYDQVIALRDQLDAAARALQGTRLPLGGLTMHFLQIEKPASIVITTATAAYHLK